MIEKKMGILSGISYGLILIAIIVLLIIKQYKFIMPSVTFIIGLHFIPQGSFF